MRSRSLLQRFSHNYWIKCAIGLLVVIILSLGANAKDKAKVPVKVKPSQAYIFLDGQAIGDGHRKLTMAPGKHTISVHNYGYIPESREIEAKAGKNPPLNFTLTASGNPVSGPMGAIQLEGPGRAAVLLNGKTPDYFVGHVDEFNNHIIWKQQLVVPAGTHHLTVTRKGKELWSGTIEVAADKRVILWLDGSGARHIKDWKPEADSLPRFKAGIASATVVVAPVKDQLTIDRAQIDCNQPAKMNWTSTDAVQAEIVDQPGAQKEVPLEGENTISPRQTTTYKLVASGPGGIAESSSTLQVNSGVTSSLSSSSTGLQPAQASSKTTQEVAPQGTATLTWSTSNADKVNISPLGVVGASGSQNVTPTAPITYVLTATNVCGGSSISRIAIQTQGAPALASVFFPTGYPKEGQEDVGLVASQQEQLKTTAAAFKQYMREVPDAKLVLLGYTDPRGDEAYNQGLSERRVDSVMRFLVSQGVPQDRIQTRAFGEEKQLPNNVITKLESQNPHPAGPDRASQQAITKLAYNRRVDIVLAPADKASAQYFPNAAPDSDILWSPATVPSSELEKQSSAGK